MTVGESVAFMDTFLHELGADNSVEIVIVPPFTALAKVSEILNVGQQAKLGAQNMHWEKPGAFTGEISAPMLRELYVRYVVLGHSERRTLFGESDEIVNKKTRAAIDAALRPIVCIGETCSTGRFAEALRVSPQKNLRMSSLRTSQSGPSVRGVQRAHSRRRKRTLSSVQNSRNSGTRRPQRKCVFSTVVVSNLRMLRS